jgi:hypothetical protein
MSDNQVLYIASIICFLFILVSFKFSKQFAIVNLILFFLYSTILYYNLVYNSAYGSGLVWWSYAILLTVLQILIVGIYLGIKFFSKN